MRKRPEKTCFWTSGDCLVLGVVPGAEGGSCQGMLLEEHREDRFVDVSLARSEKNTTVVRFGFC